MKLGLNVLFLEPGKVGGSETFTRSIIEELDRSFACDNEVFLYCTKSFGDSVDLKNVKLRVLLTTSKNRFLRILFEFFLLPIFLAKDRVDVLFSFGYTSPLFTTCKKAVVIYDVQYKAVPYTLPFLHRVVYDLIIPFVVHFNDKIVTLSQFSKHEIMKFFGLSSKKIAVVYGSIDCLKRKIVERRDLFIMSSSATHPHKNMDVVVKAFDFLSRIKAYERYKLYLTGFPAKGHKNVVEMIIQNGLSNKVKFLGWLDRDILFDYLGKASCFVFPSSYEGFGYPPLEAMALGTPVIASRRGSLPEILGDACVYLNDERDFRELATKLDILLRDRNLRRKLGAKGVKRASTFSKTRSYEAFVEIVEELYHRR